MTTSASALGHSTGFRAAQNVHIEVQNAGLASRGAAAMLDYLILLVVNVVVLAVGAVAVGIMDGAGDRDTSALVALGVVVFFLLNMGFFFLAHVIGKGQTPGKRFARIRVVSQDGGPASALSLFIRSLILPFDMLIGPWFMVFHRRMLRLGDMAAGTMVIHEGGPVPVELTELPPNASADEVALLELWLREHEALRPERKQELGDRIVTWFDTQHPGYLPEGATNEERLERLRA